MPPLFAIAYLQTLQGGGADGFAALLFASLVVTGTAIGSYGHLVNDIFDLELDRGAGRELQVGAWTPLVRAAVCGVLLVVAFAPLVFVSYGMVAILILVAEAVLPTIYAAPPIRLKERGGLGIVADALGAHVVPALFLLFVFAQPRAPDPAVIILIVLWSFALGAKGILYHQLCDRDKDLPFGISTFASRHHPSRVRLLITDIAHPVEVASFTLLVVLLAPSSWILAVFFALHIMLDITKRNLGWTYSHSTTPTFERRHTLLVSSFFYELWFPLALALSLAIEESGLWWLPLIHLFVFPRNISTQLHDLKSLATFIVEQREHARDGGSPGQPR